MRDVAVLKPPPVRRGDRIAVVAPASRFDAGALASGFDELRRLGFTPVFYPAAFSARRHVAGEPADRARALMAAWNDPDVAAVFTARGGYGSVELLPHLSVDELRRSPKPLVGYSDITALLSLLTTRCRITALHGPCVAAGLDRGASGYDAPTLVRALTSGEAAGALPASGLETLQAGDASGPLFGGNLTQLAASMGTPYAFDPPDGCVLFLEDVNERPYRIDRLLTQLRFAGIVARARAVIFGELPGCDEGDGSLTAREVVAGAMRGFPGPVVWGLPAGHTAGPSLTLPLGVRARVSAGASSVVEILESAVADVPDPRDRSQP
jgi:muramoyltetrapeptide carboxypeptidase